MTIDTRLDAFKRVTSTGPGPMTRAQGLHKCTLNFNNHSCEIDGLGSASQHLAVLLRVWDFEERTDAFAIWDPSGAQSWGVFAVDTNYRTVSWDWMTFCVDGPNSATAQHFQ